MIKWKTISSKIIVNDLHSTISTNTSVDITTLIKWVYKCMDKIGSKMMLVTKIAGINNNPDMNFTNYQVPLPSDFKSLEYVLIDGCPAQLTNSAGMYLINNDCVTLPSSEQLGTIINDPKFIDGFGNIFGPVSGTPQVGYCNTQFTINSDYITVTQQTGEAAILYNAYDTDDEGFPMIPDIECVREAITRYIIMMLDYDAWRTGDIEDKIFKHSEREYMWYIAQAIDTLKEPDIHQTEMMMKEQLKLVKQPNRYKNMFNRR